MGSKKLWSKGTLWMVAAALFILFAASGALAADCRAVIENFYAEPAIVASGETTMLYWKVTNATAIEIIGIEKEPEEMLPLEGSLEVWPMVTTSYIVIAHGFDGNAVSKSVTVNVGLKGEVSIDYFKASATQVNVNDTVTLLWKAHNAESVRVLGISEKDDECVRPIEGSIEVWPLETTTYLLEATGYNGEITSASITVNVKEVTVTEPKILTFTASKTTISRGDLALLTWTTENAVKCKLTTDDGGVLLNRPANGSIAVTPNKTKTFTLTAYDADGKQAQASLTIIVK
jgi:plastocyanin